MVTIKQTAIDLFGWMPYILAKEVFRGLRMATNKVRCNNCKGTKKYSGIGGITKDCIKCDDKGFVEIESHIGGEVLHSFDEFKEDVKQLKDAQVIETASPTKPLSPTKLKQRMKSTRAKIKSKTKIEEPVTADMFPLDAPKSDRFMEAILAEPRMEPMLWAQTYKDVSRLFGINPITHKPDELTTKVQRAALREQYAQAQPKVARKVDMGAQQDSSVENDPAVVAQVKKTSGATK